MSENREEILADFQACTGLEDVAEAIYHLEETNWDLLRAVSRVMPPDTQSFHGRRNDPDVMIVENDDDADVPPAVPPPPASAFKPVQSATDRMMDIGNHHVHGHPPAKKREYSMSATSSLPNFGAGTSGSSSGGGGGGSKDPLMLTFKIMYCDRVIKIRLPDSANLSDLKQRIQNEVSVAPCRQTLSGWARIQAYEKTPFSQLMLPRENELFLTVKSLNDGVTAEDDNEMSQKLNGTYTLHIKFENKTYDLKYQGTKPILQVKTDIYSLTNVPVRHQVWTGWPPNIDDNTLLALSGISYPAHELTVRKNPNVRDREKKSMPKIVHLDSDDEEYEDASESFNVDDEYFVDNENTARKQEPLIPDNVEDELVGTVTFNERFTARYGPIHPMFFQGTLEDALKEACNKPAKDRKILAIYLHHDASVLTNVFCTQLLGFESIMEIIEKNFVLWGWDITFESNRQKFFGALANCLGPTAPLSLRNIPVDRLPAMVLIMKIRSATEVFNVINGNVGVNELLSTLIECVEVFGEHQKVEAKEEAERAERELVKWEQDEAYRASLEADRKKEEVRQRQEREERETKRRIENELAETAARKEAHRQEVEGRLPVEPPVGAGEQTKIRFRLPEGENIERRFTADTPLRVLLDFMIVQGYPTEEYKVISSWPRRDLTALDDRQTLKELKLCPQETVILEKR
ncbi:FAS-associated factor 1 [Anthonomus grandis grandis]|uniref:FAS-associated factor 1 n=1 Tax=Anthonomus grandis grandis TaxID=2921223 RepID=UPI002164FD30|nr:FAS-associated factor 1 [Anthonomus grandis grandis]